MVTIPAGQYLYRAAPTVEEHPTPRFADDTGKTGVHFAYWSPYLSEMMIPEYEKDLWVGVYEIIEDITGLYPGKWDRPDCLEECPPECNVSHIDFNIGPIYWLRDFYKDDHDGHMEVFLTEKDLSKIKLIDSYFMTQEECEEKWGLDEWK